MKTGTTLLGAAAMALVAITVADPASAKTRYHHYGYHHHHHGYGAFAQYRGRRPTGPSNPNFEMGSGWNNGSPRHPQYGRPGHF
jgi:hypothetical protein